MTGDADDVSPRTPRHPMAFTDREFFWGAVAAWLWFLVLASVAYALMFGLYALVAAAHFIPWSLGALIVFSPAAWLLGRALRTVRRVRVHIALFAVLGGVVGVAATLAWAAVTGIHEGSLPILLLVNVALSAVAVPSGWWAGARRTVRPMQDAR